MNDCPGNVAKDAKYTVRSGQTRPIVALTYNTKDDEKWYNFLRCADGHNGCGL